MDTLGGVRYRGDSASRVVQDPHGVDDIVRTAPRSHEPAAEQFLARSEVIAHGVRMGSQPLGAALDAAVAVDPGANGPQQRTAVTAQRGEELVRPRPGRRLEQDVGKGRGGRLRGQHRHVLGQLQGQIEQRPVPHGPQVDPEQLLHSRPTHRDGLAIQPHMPSGTAVAVLEGAAHGSHQILRLCLGKPLGAV